MRAKRLVAAEVALDSDSSNQRGHKKRKKGTKKFTGPGTARQCDLCKEAGMPVAKYTLHWTRDCQDKAEMRVKLSGNKRERDSAISGWKKEQKALKKDMKKLQKNNKKLMKLIGKKKPSSSKEMRKLRARLAESCIESSSNSSSSSSRSNSSSSSSDSDSD